MKYVMAILAGAIDHAIKQLGDRSPLMVAAGENLQAMARKSRIGAVQPLPPDWKGDPEAAVTSLLGYNPGEHFTARGPLEAAAQQIDLDRTDIALSVNLIHTDGRRLLDPTAGQFPPAAGGELIRHVQDTLRARMMQFFPGSGSRHVMVWRDGPDGLECRPPYPARGELLRAHFPIGDRAEQLTSVMWDTAEILADHPINRRRRDEGKPTADMVWPWSPGRQPKLEGFGVRHGIGGACVAGSETVRGLARLCGLRVLSVPGATGTLDTDYAMKAKAVLSALEDVNFCLVHIEAPHVASLAGDVEAKIDALKRIDERFFGTLLDRIGTLDDFRILVVPDHPTYVEERRAAPDWVPFMLTGNREKAQVRGILPFDERALDDAEWRIGNGWELLDELFA